MSLFSISKKQTMRTIKNTTDTEIRRSFINEFTFGDKDKAIRVLIQTSRDKRSNEDSNTDALVSEIASGFSRLASALTTSKQTPVRDF